MTKQNRKIIYLDHAAATALDPRVFAVMRPFLKSAFGNPSSLHRKGAEAKRAIEASRKIIANIIGARTEEIVFTSGGTESCNLAILGLTRKNAEIRNAEKRGSRPHIITTAIEHHAVLEPVRVLQKQGWRVTYLPVDKAGFISSDDLKKAIRQETVLASVMYVNNEIGTIQPIAEIGRIISRINIERLNKGLPAITFHTDACQAAGSLDLNVNRLQVDLMSVSASKICGPKGVGFLYVRRGVNIRPIIYGGGQERGFRSGTENVAGIVGLAKALELATMHRQRENKRLISLRDYLIERIKRSLPKVILNGPEIDYQPISSKSNGRRFLRIGSRLNRLPNNLNLTIPGVEGEALMLYLDAQGICVSTGSACTTGSTDVSHILTAIGRSEKQSKQSIRITLGKTTVKKDLDYMISVLLKTIKLIRNHR